MPTNKSKLQRLADPRPSARRDFLRQLGAGGIAAAGAALAGSAANGLAATAAPSSETPAPLPTIQLAGKTVTRLITGGNPLIGASQPSLNLSRLMNDYFTAERIADLILQSEKAGINTLQASYADKIDEGLRIARDRGSKIQWICLAAGGEKASFDKILALKPFALAHHGGVTDRLFREGKSEQINDFIKQVHDQGVAAGVSSHVPNNIRAVEEKGWDNEFFMNCFYNVVRGKEDMRREFGALPVDNLYFMSDDPKVMTKVIRESRKPCLAFKILAAGRLCWTPQSVDETFRFAFANIKPTDAVIVGMFPRFEDEPALNAALTRKHGKPA